MNNNDLSKWLLRAMLIALAVGAFAGAYGLLLGLGGYEGAITGTLIGLGIASGLVMRTLSRLENPLHRPAALFIIGMIGFLFLYWCGLLWASDLLHWSTEGKLWGTKGVLWGTGAATAVCLYTIMLPGGKVAAYTGFFFAAAFTGVALIAIWMESESAGLSSVAIFGFGIIITAPLMGLGDDQRHWRWPGVAGGVLGLALALPAIWNDHASSPVLIIMMSSMSIAILVSYANLILRINLQGTQVWLRHAAMVCLTGALVMLVISVRTYRDVHDITDMPMMRAFMAGAFLTICATVAMVVMNRLNRVPVRSEHAPQVEQVTVLCPLCEGQITTPVSVYTADPVAAAAAPFGRCEPCNVAVRVQVTVPHCPKCGYLLLRFAGDSCPECGQALESILTAAAAR